MTANVAAPAPAPEAKAAQPGKGGSPASPDAALFAMMVRAEETPAEPTASTLQSARAVAKAAAKIKAGGADAGAGPVKGEPTGPEQSAQAEAEPPSQDGAALAAAQLTAQPQASAVVQAAQTAPAEDSAAETVEEAVSPHPPTFQLARLETADPGLADPGLADPALAEPDPLLVAEASTSAQAQAPAAPAQAKAPPVTSAQQAAPAPAPEAAPPDADPAPAAAAAPEPAVLARAEAQAMAPAAALVETAAAEIAPAARPTQPPSFKPASGSRGAGAQASSQQNLLFGMTEAAPRAASPVPVAGSTGEDGLILAEASADPAPPTFDLAAGPDAAPADGGGDTLLLAQPTAASGQAAAQPGAGEATPHAATVPALAAEIARKLEAKASRFEVQLDPLGLGQVMVQVKIDAGGRLSAALSFENAAAAAQMHARAGELRAQLEQAGFDLSRGGLSFDTAGGQGFEGGQGFGSGQAQDGSAAFRGRAFGRARQTLDLADVAATPRRPAASGLDLRI